MFGCSEDAVSSCVCVHWKSTPIKSNDSCLRWCMDFICWIASGYSYGLRNWWTYSFTCTLSCQQCFACTVHAFETHWLQFWQIDAERCTPPNLTYIYIYIDTKKHDLKNVSPFCCGNFGYLCQISVGLVIIIFHVFQCFSISWTSRKQELLFLGHWHNSDADHSCVFDCYAITHFYILSSSRRKMIPFIRCKITTHVSLFVCFSVFCWWGFTFHHGTVGIWNQKKNAKFCRQSLERDAGC